MCARGLRGRCPEDLDPADVLSLVFIYMTAYQMLHRAANAKSGQTVLVHGAAGRVGTAVLELAAAAGLRVYGTASAHDRAAVERLGAVAIDYRHEDFLARVRCADRRGGGHRPRPVRRLVALRSLRALRPGGWLVIYGRQNTIVHGRKNWPGVYRVVRGDRGGRAVGPTVAPSAGACLSHPETARAPSRLVPARTSARCSSCSVRARSTRSSRSACRCPTRAARTNCSQSSASIGKLVLVP